MLMAQVRAAGTSRLACRDTCDFILTSQCWSLALSVPRDCLIPWTLGIPTRPEIFSFWGHPGATCFLTLVAPVQILYATRFSVHHLRAYCVLGTKPSTFTVSHVALTMSLQAKYDHRQPRTLRLREVERLAKMTQIISGETGIPVWFHLPPKPTIFTLKLCLLPHLQIPTLVSLCTTHLVPVHRYLSTGSKEHQGTVEN